MTEVGNPDRLLANQLTERQLKKIEQLSPRVSREHMMRLVVDADLPAVLRTAVERYGWRHVLEMLRELAFMQDIEAEKEKKDGPFRVIGLLIDQSVLQVASGDRNLGKKT